MTVEEKGEFRWSAIMLASVVTAVFAMSGYFAQYLDGLALVSSEVVSRPWTAVTYMFLHSSFSHIFYNMFALVMFGSILEKVVGYKKFLMVFFGSGIASGIASVFFYPSVIGASGAIFGVMGTLAVLRPKMVVWTLGVPMYMMLAIVVWAVLDFGGMFYPDQTAHVGHLAGLFVGVAAGLVLFEEHKIIEKKERKQRLVLSDEEFRTWEDKYMRGRG